MDNTIRLSKVTKIIGVITVAIFSVVVLGLLVTKHIGAAICFTPFIILGAALIFAYQKQTIVVTEDELIFNYLIKKTQHVKYKDIRCLLVIPLNDRTQLALIDKNYNRIITLDIMLENSEILHAALVKNGVELVDFGQLVEEKQDISKYVGALNWMERNYYNSIYHEDKTIKEMSKKKKKEEVTKTKKLLKILGWVFIISDVVAFLIGGKIMVILFTAVLLGTYAVYVKYYPYIFIEVQTKKGQQAYQLPFIGAALALLNALNLGKMFNYQFGAFMKITAIITLLLLIPFAIKSFRSSVKQRFARKLSVAFAAFILAFSISFPVNFLLTFDAPTHEETIVIEKHISSGKTRDRELYVRWNDGRKIYNVSRSEYERTNIGDTKRICMRKSILGLEYSTLHN